MQLLATATGALIILCVLYVMLFPAAFQARLPTLLSGTSLYAIALLRLLIGCLLLAVAAQSRHPPVMAGLGWLTVLAGLLLFVIPPATLERIAKWYAGLPVLALRLMLPLALAFGAYIIFGVDAWR